MAHLHAKHMPFALAMLPFFAIGIASPVTIQDWWRDRLLPGDLKAFLIGWLVLGAWEWAILLSIRSKKRRGQDQLLGQSLSSWYWAPPFAFVLGVISGIVFICN